MKIEYRENQTTADFSTFRYFRTCHPEATILAVDDIPVVGMCAICERPIIAGDMMQLCSDGSMVCGACVNRLPRSAGDIMQICSEKDNEDNQ